MKNIVVGYDGSTCADTAVDFVSSLAWGPDASVTLITVIPDVRKVRSVWGSAVVGSSAQIDAQLTTQGQDALDAPVARLRAQGLACEPVVVRGQAPEGIAAVAESDTADLIVVGSRGRGPIRAMLLGSVSEAVIDLASSPVLVVRTPAVTQVVFGTDGSPGAQAAEQSLMALPLAAGVAVRVVSVADIVRPSAIGLDPALYRDAMAWQVESEADALRVHQQVAQDAADRLRAHGMQVASEARAGDPAGELLAAATEVGADLIVVGSRGRTGLARLVLGSVARRVVQHAKASVMVAARP